VKNKRGLTVLGGHTSAQVGDGRTKRIVVVASLAFSLVNFRLELLRRMSIAGHKVVALAPEDCADSIVQLESLGIQFINLPLKRASWSPLRDLQTLLELVGHFRRLQPDVVLAYTMKPIIYGCLAGRLTGVPHRYALVTGLGYVFTDRQKAGFRATFLKRISIVLYRLALRGAERVFVYNTLDAEEIRKNRFIKDVSHITLVPGSGVDTQHYGYSEPAIDPPIFLMISRLLHDKGVREYVAAARALKARYPDVRCQLLGPFDSNPSAISRAEVDAWVKENAIEYCGETKDVRPYLAKCSVFVLPSYREGMARTILEAMSTGRAVIASDAPGCADPVLLGESGLVVPVRNVSALTAAMEEFVRDPSLISRMGLRAREIAIERFDVHEINRRLMLIMDLM
jgi:glycosyltransferase involved in cell wall biosynthesis